MSHGLLNRSRRFPEPNRTAYLFNKEILVDGPEAKTAIMTNTEIKEIGNTNYHIYTVKTDNENRNEILFMVLFILAISGFFTFAMYLYIREYKNKEDLIEKLNYQNDNT